MSSYPWNVCRTCLSVQNIYPIFNMREHHEKYTDVILTTTGVKVELNDNLPQQMCLFCITFINDSVKFRKKCEDSNMELLSRLIDKQTEAIKVETSPEFKTENDKSVTIDITHLLPDLDEDFKDYDDNITLDSLQCNNSVEKTCIAVEFDGQDKNSTEKPVLLEENNEQTEVEKPKRKLRSSKKENVGVKKKAKAKEEKVREEVECEYCHKILTSRLSLRNHYKIHTGFDVVCEHCGKKFITRRLLLMHCRAKHGYEKTDKCSYCDYRASNAEQVKGKSRMCARSAALASTERAATCNMWQYTCLRRLFSASSAQRGSSRRR
ncbi:zinc finger protein 652-like isoform X2 [Pectinophora gossypiella]|uniref:zinc finger protein 652-like isoform X2 n=1 Tax=Pectinophora gossypiella TaxID=13191 RepID=UPI00214F1D0D|nr:zinc finger protein 652-like isoform X2 [Pectinophora gossypiella]